MRHLVMYESFPAVFGDPMYGGDIFRIRYRNINDLSNKRGNDTKPKPENDMLDNFQPGDIVRGKVLDGEDYKEGKIVSIKRDEEGENVAIEIEADGEIVKLATSTVAFTKDGDKGNSKPVAQLGSVHGELDPTSGDTFEPTTNEKLVHIKNFSNYNG